MKQAQKRPARSPELAKLMGRDELNLAEFPIASLSHRVPEDCKQLVFEDEIRDQASGLVVPRKLIITGHATLGLPNSLDDDVIVVLMHVSKERNNFTSRVVPFHRMECVEMLGWPRNGQSIDRLEESLSRWHGVSLRYENAWWDKVAQTWRTEEFHIIDNVSSFDRIATRRIRQNTEQACLPLSTFSWNETVFRSFQSGNVKSIDLDMYFKLSLAPSRRAYRFLDKRFYRDTELRFDLKSFATDKIGFSAAYSAAKIKEKLQPALDELEDMGFLEPMSRENRYEKISHGTWKIVLVRGSEVKGQEQSTVAPEPHATLVAALIARGVSGDAAAALVRDHDATTIQEQIEILDFRLSGKKADKIDDPAAWLVSAIKCPHATPKGFISAADRLKQQEARKAQELTKAEADRQKRAEEAQARQEKSLIIGFWEGLSTAQQAEHEAAAIAQASADDLKLIQPGPMKQYGMTILRHNYARRQLQAQGKLPPATT